MSKQLKHVLIVGGGFGGVKSAIELSKHPEFKVTLLSDRDNFDYHPSLYHTATGGSAEVSSIPLVDILKNTSVEIIKGEATKLDRGSKKLGLKNGQLIAYDVLILSLGMVTNYFGIKGMKEYSYGIKNIAEAEELKRHLHKQLIDDLKPDLNYIIIGGGPTGVELAGALPAYMNQIIKKHGLPKRRVHIDLVEAMPRLMPRMPKSSSRIYARRLRALGVKLYLGTPVQAETANALLMHGKYVRSHTVIWTAGLANHPFFSHNGFQIEHNGKVQVDKLLQAWPGIFVIGDNANTPYSGMAQTALYDARFVIENLVRHQKGQQPYAYKAKKPVYITPVGRRWAGVYWGRVSIFGWVGWLLRSAADWVGYKDFEPWWEATELLLASNDQENKCRICDQKK